MKSAIALFLAPFALCLAACAGWFTLDGGEVSYTEVPAGYESHPHFTRHGVAVYEVDGRYYQQHGNRWVVYRSRPGDLQEERAAAHAAEQHHEAERHEEHR